jgi:hypothetical protein
MIKLTFCLVRLPHLSLADFQSYWRDHHAPLVRARADVLRIRRYVQSHSLPEESHPWVRASRGAPASFDGVAELWWECMEDFSSRDPAALAAGSELLEDEKRFIDLARSPLFLGQENEVVAAR